MKEFVEKLTDILMNAEWRKEASEQSGAFLFLKTTRLEYENFFQTNF